MLGRPGKGRNRSGNTLPILAAHDHMVAIRRGLKKRHVITQRPNQVVVLADDTVGRNRRDEGNTHY